LISRVAVELVLHVFFARCASSVRRERAQVMHSGQDCDTPTCEAWDELVTEKELANCRAEAGWG